MVKEVGSCAYYNNYLALTRLIPEKNRVHFGGVVGGRGLFDVAENSEWIIKRFTGVVCCFCDWSDPCMNKAIVLWFIDTAWLCVNEWNRWQCRRLNLNDVLWL